MDKTAKTIFVEVEREVSKSYHIASCGLITAGGLITLLGRKIPPATKLGFFLIMNGIALAPFATINEVIYRIAKD